MNEKINFEILDKILSDLAQTESVTGRCAGEISEFLQTHSMESFSDESLEELGGLYILVIKPSYEKMTGMFLPNIFGRF